MHLAMPLEDGEPVVKDECITVVEGSGGKRNFGRPQFFRLVAGDPKEAAFILLWRHMLEACSSNGTR